MTRRVHKRFRAMLRDLGLTTGDAAAALGCDRSFVSVLQNGGVPGLALAVEIERLSKRWERGPIVPSEWVVRGARRTPKPAPSTGSDEVADAAA